MPVDARPSPAPPPPLAPLRGYRVVNLAVNVPGPVAAARLQALGATVCKVEPPGGDPLAAAAPAWYEELTAGQEVVRLDLKTPAGRVALDQRLARADLLLTAQRPSALARLGLGPAALARRFPHLVHVAIVGYPAPRQEEPGHDLTYLAETGLLDPPALPRTLLADLAGAERAVAAALALLLARERERDAHRERRWERERAPTRPRAEGADGGATPSPRYVEVSLAEAAHALAAPLRHGLTVPGGLLGGGLPLYRCYPAQDGWVAVAALEPHFARRLLDELGPPGPGLPPGVEERLAAVFRRRPAAEWEAWARQRDLPLAAVRTGPGPGRRRPAAAG